MKTVKLTAEEVRAIEAFLWANPCSNGCVYSEMEKSKKNCDKCKLEKSKNSILEKLDLI